MFKPLLLPEKRQGMRLTCGAFHGAYIQVQLSSQYHKAAIWRAYRQTEGQTVLRYYLWQQVFGENHHRLGRFIFVLYFSCVAATLK